MSAEKSSGSVRSAMVLLATMFTTTFVTAEERCVDVGGTLSRLPANECPDGNNWCWQGRIDNGLLQGENTLTARRHGHEIVGTASIQTAKGDLKLEVRGADDSRRGMALETQRIVGGTGVMAGLSGTLVVRTSQAEGRMLGRLSGLVCGAEGSWSRIATEAQLTRITAAAPVRRFRGNYRGTFSGGDSGTFAVRINKNGVISGTAFSNLAGVSFDVSGRVRRSGKTRFSGNPSGTTDGGAVFAGRIDAATGQASGTWRTLDNQFSGSFSGARN